MEILLPVLLLKAGSYVLLCWAFARIALPDPSSFKRAFAAGMVRMMLGLTIGLLAFYGLGDTETLQSKIIFVVIRMALWASVLWIAYRPRWKRLVAGAGAGTAMNYFLDLLMFEVVENFVVI